MPASVPLRIAADLHASFPVTGFWHVRSHDGEKYFDYLARPLTLVGAGEPWQPAGLAPSWRSIVDQVLSPDYRAALESAAGVSLAGTSPEASAWRWGASAQLGPHLDLPSKVLTHVLYLNVGWRSSWGGCLRVLRSKDEADVAAELPPALGSSSVLVRSDRSWHAVTPVTAEAPVERLSLIVTWLVDGTESPAWTPEADGSVTAKAGVGPAGRVGG